jgi:hypothetical protein
VLHREVEVERQRAELQRQMAELRTAGTSIWADLAGALDTDEQVVRFFQRRQRQAHRGEPRLRIFSIVRVENRARLQAFHRGHDVHLRPADAHRQGTDTWLFHGCSREAASNIQAEGLLLRFARQDGMLGQGLYGAPNPRKSWHDCLLGPAGVGDLALLFVCRFSLAAPVRHAGPRTPHRNSLYDEYCVYAEDRVVVLWMLKVERDTTTRIA